MRRRVQESPAPEGQEMIMVAAAATFLSVLLLVIGVTVVDRRD